MTAYILGSIDVHEPEAYLSDYVPGANASVVASGGRLLAAGGHQELPEGPGFLPRAVILEFPDFDAALAWYGSDRYQEVLPARRATATSSMLAIEGLDEGSTLGGAFVIATMEVTDLDTYKNDYGPRAVATLVQYGGRFLARGGRAQTLEGDVYGPRTVVIEFASLEAALAWYRSPEYQPLIPIRRAAAKGTFAIVEGGGPH